jgi:REP element-mobilizing transposase RayT
VLRGTLPDGYFHVTARGVNGAEIFLVDLDRFDFLELLERVTERFGLRIVARCLMDTHYHLVVETATEKLSRAMQQLNGAYALRFNNRHERHGHVFGERFRSRVIRSEAHLLAAVQYVVDNPAKAGACRPDVEWPWTAVQAVIPQRSTASRSHVGSAEPGRAPRPV